MFLALALPRSARLHPPAALGVRGAFRPLRAQPLVRRTRSSTRSGRARLSRRRLPLRTRRSTGSSADCGDGHVAEEGVVAGGHGDRAPDRLARDAVGASARTADRRVAGDQRHRRRQLQPERPDDAVDPGAARPASAGRRCLAASASLVSRAAAAPPTRWARCGPLVLVALSCAFCLFVLTGELTPAPNLNDSAFHLQMVRWADGADQRGSVPLDGWYPYLSLGSSHFHHYQSLPHTLTAYTAHVTGAGDQTTYLWFLYLLLALWPLAVFWGGRLLGWGRWTAAAAAAVSPLVVSAPGLRLRARQLHVAGVRRLLPAVGDVAAAASPGASPGARSRAARSTPPRHWRSR